jgi:endogenous inhibitor of DNA gyrase (YacG/DUF329 family)
MFNRHLLNVKSLNGGHMEEACAGCGRKVKIVTHRAGVPWCSRCNMNDIRARASVSKEAHGKGMELASAGMSKLEQWSDLTNIPGVKGTIQKLLVILRALMVIELGGATPDEYAQVADLIPDDNPFATVNDPAQEPLDVEFDSRDEPAVSPHRDAESTPSHATTGARTAPRESPEVKPEVAPPSPDQSDGATLVGLSDECREELMVDMGYTPSEVNRVEVRRGLGARAEIEEALRQLGEQHER